MGYSSVIESFRSIWDAQIPFCRLMVIFFVRSGIQFFENPQTGSKVAASISTKFSRKGGLPVLISGYNGIEHWEPGRCDRWADAREPTGSKPARFRILTWRTVESFVGLRHTQTRVLQESWRMIQWVLRIICTDSGWFDYVTR